MNDNTDKNDLSSPFSPYSSDYFSDDFLHEEFDINSPSAINAISNEIKFQTLNIEPNNNWQQVAPNLTPAAFETELQLRNNLLLNQQKRIKQLEELLSKATLEIDKLQHEVSVHLREKEVRNKSIKNQSRYWTSEEHERFLQALDLFGSKDVKSIANHVSTRSPTQVRTHAQKYFLRLERERRREGEKKVKLEGGNNNNNNNNNCNNSDGLGNRNNDDNDVDDERFNQTNERVITPKSEIKKEKKRIARTDISHSSLPNLNNQSYCFNTFKNTASKSKSPIKNNEKPLISTDIPSLNNPQKFSELEKFLAGLEATKGEPDIEKKCQSIQENFLPNNTIEEIKAWIFVHIKTVEKLQQDEVDTVVNNIGAKRSRKSCPPGYAGSIGAPLQFTDANNQSISNVNQNSNLNNIITTNGGNAVNPQSPNSSSPSSLSASSFAKAKHANVKNYHRMRSFSSQPNIHLLRPNQHQFSNATSAQLLHSHHSTQSPPQPSQAHSPQSFSPSSPHHLHQLQNQNANQNQFTTHQFQNNSMPNPLSNPLFSQGDNNNNNQNHIIDYSSPPEDDGRRKRSQTISAFPPFYNNNNNNETFTVNPSVVIPNFLNNSFHPFNPHPLSFKNNSSPLNITTSNAPSNISASNSNNNNNVNNNANNGMHMFHNGFNNSENNNNMMSNEGVLQYSGNSQFQPMAYKPGAPPPSHPAPPPPFQFH